MTKDKLPTISLKGKDYVQVKDRIAYFNGAHSNGHTETAMTYHDTNIVTFKASVYPDSKNADRYFTGHSFGTTDEVKAFEKLETVAVGRALAFMGIGVIESVASADEIDRFNKKVPYSNVPQDTHKEAYQASDIKPCSKCQKPLVLRNGKSGPFYGCSGYPKCSFTLDMEAAEMWKKNEAPPLKEY